MPMNHPNRSRNKAPHSSPLPERIRRERERRGLTQKEAADLIFCSLAAWQQWESGVRRMHPAFWALFQLKSTEVSHG